MQPSEPRRVLALVNRRITLAMIFEGPHRPPKILVIRCHHATLTAGGHDLVLTETPRADVPDAADAAALVTRAMGLCTIFDDFEVVLGG